MEVLKLFTDGEKVTGLEPCENGLKSLKGKSKGEASRFLINLGWRNTCEIYGYDHGKRIDPTIIFVRD